MDIHLRKYFSGKNINKDIKFTYDSSSDYRPSWIFVENLPEDAMFLSTRINGKIQHYRIYLSTKIPLFLPVDYTSEEMRKFYDKFSEMYDSVVSSRNKEAAEFLLSKYKLPKDSEILDLGAGTGLSSKILINSGYKNITLLDFSQKMLNKAKKKRCLNNCKFVNASVLDFNTSNKFDMIFSIFSFASKSYFKRSEMLTQWNKIYELLDNEGILMLMGNDFEPPKSLFKRIDSGKYPILPDFSVNWFIGKKNK